MDDRCDPLQRCAGLRQLIPVGLKYVVDRFPDFEEDILPLGTRPFVESADHMDEDLAAACLMEAKRLPAGRSLISPGIVLGWGCLAFSYFVNPRPPRANSSPPAPRTPFMRFAPIPKCEYNRYRAAIGIVRLWILRLRATSISTRWAALSGEANKRRN